MSVTQRSGLRAYIPDNVFATPPTDDEKYLFLRGGPGRALIVLQYLAFLGVLVSFAGFSTTSYWTLIFLFPLSLTFVGESISLYTSGRRQRITLESHRALVASWAPEHFPAVDVFLPSAGEELTLLENTFEHVARLDWPGPLEVIVLDDSGRSAVRALADRYGFNYLARPTHEYNKAGNLRHGERRSNGDFVTVLDADFVPRPDYLLELVPYLDDESVGVVQSPQFFDTTREMNWVRRTAGATQELFYRFIQSARDRDSAAICCGSSAVYRRSALVRIGGFPKIGQSEDIFTGIEMRRQGFYTRYVPVIVSKGLCPDNLDNFIAQQYRWCEGSMRLMMSREFHADTSMSLRARLSFWSGFLYYISTAFSALLIPLPAIIMAWFYPGYVRWWNTVWLVGVLALWAIAYPLAMRGRWRIEVLRLQTVYGFAHAFNILHVLKETVADWHPTGRTAAPPVARAVKRFYTWYLGGALVVLVAGLSLRTAQEGFARFAGMLAFSALNLYVAGPLVWRGAQDARREWADRSGSHFRDEQAEIDLEAAELVR